jgi:hypothetical protein
MRRIAKLAAIVVYLVLLGNAAAGPAGTLECPNSDEGVRLIDLAKNSPEAAIASLIVLYGTPQSQIRYPHQITLTWRRTKTVETPASSLILTLGLLGEQSYRCNSGWSLK